MDLVDHLDVNKNTTTTTTTVTIPPTRQIRDVTNQDIAGRSERAKHLSQRTVVNLTSAYVRLVTIS